MKISSKQGLSSVVTPKNEIASPELRKKIKTGKIKYKLSSNKTTVREGEQFTLSLKTDEKTFPIGTKIPYTITGITSADVDNKSLTGNFIVGSTKRITYKVTKDNIQPETETITVALDEFPTGINGTGSVSIQLSDQLPTYTLLRSSVLINEGDTVTMTLKTIGVANSTSIAYAITGVDLNDLSGESSLTGTMVVTNNSASKTLTIVDDSIIEGYNDLTFALTGLGTSGTNYETSSVISQSVKIKEKVTWELSSNQTALEGSTVTFNLATKNIPNGKKFNYEVTGVTSNDFVGVPGVDWSVDNTVDITPNNSSDEVFLTYGGGKFMAATTDKIWSSIDGTSWTHVHTPTNATAGGITYGNNLHYDGTNWWYCNTQCIDMSSDGGTTWTNKEDLTPGTYSFVDTIHSDGNGRVYFGGLGFNYTDDNGASFNNTFPILYFMVTHSAIGGASSGVTTRSIITATQNSVDYVVALAHEGNQVQLDKGIRGIIAYSTNNAVSWTKVGGSTLCFGGNPVGYGFAPEDIVYADGVWIVVGYRTSGDTSSSDPHVSTWDRGQIYTSTSISNSSWTKIVDDANYGPFYRVLYQHNRLIALGKRVILISDDKGTTWTAMENNNIIPADTYVIGGYYDGTNLYMSGTNGWIGKVKLTDATPSLTGSFTIDNNAATTSFNLKDKDTIESESMTLTITTNDVGGHTKTSGSDEYNNVISKTVVITDAGDGPKLVLSSSSNTIVQDGSSVTITLDKDDYPAGSSIVWRAYYFSGTDIEQGGNFGYFTTSNAITNINLNSPVELTISPYNVLTKGNKYPDNGAQIQISGITGTTELNGNTYYSKRLNTSGSSIALYSDAGLTSPVDGSSFTAYTSGGWVVNDTLTATFEVGPWTGSGVYADQQIELYIGGNLDSNGNVSGFPVTIDQTSVTTITLQGSDS